MGNGDSVRESNERKGAMVYSPAVYDVPLLPYEKQLIRTLGCTEEEYKIFSAEVRKKGRLRPAEYKHIPDIKNDAVTPILINLAISLVLTGVAYLLTPKPRQPSAPRQRGGGQRTLDSLVGADRFVSSTGFDSTAELADYDAPIPVIFGLYDEATESGGVLISPKLVWSRIFSQGMQQSAKLMFVVGERGVFANGFAGIPRPDEASFFLGNNRIDPVFDELYTIYWNRNTGDNDSGRILKNNLAYPEDLRNAPGNIYDADNDLIDGVKKEDVFTCPNATNDQSTDFCQALSPSNSSQFGLYAPIKNGTPFRPNWRVISIPLIDKKPDRNKRTRRERIKIAGNIRTDGNRFKEIDMEHVLRLDGMKGTGRNYCSRMGLVEVEQNGTISRIPGGSSDQKRIVKNIKKGDVAVFILEEDEIPEDLLGKEVGQTGFVSIEDINQAVRSQQIAADNMLRVGEIFAIGGAKWQVTKRRISLFDNGVRARKQRIELKCIDASGGTQSTRVGIVNPRSVVKGDGTLSADGEDIKLQGFIGDQEAPEVDTLFYPLMRIATGTFTNTRKCHTTEIGIKSVVYQRLNGLANFNTIPTAEELIESDEDRLQITSGTINSYIKRASVFQLYAREKGTNKFLQVSRLPFVVIGSNPTAAYNSILVRHKEARFDFKFLPISGAQLASFSDEDFFIRLDASLDNTDDKSDAPGIVTEEANNFKIETKGTIVTLSSFQVSKELVSNQKVKPAETITTSTPTSVKATGIEPSQIIGSRVVGVRRQPHVQVISTSPDPESRGDYGALTREIFGTVIRKRTKTVIHTEFFPGPDNLKRWVKIQYKATSYKFDLTSHWAYLNGLRYNWNFDNNDPDNIVVLDSSKNWDGKGSINIKRGEVDSSRKDQSSTPGFSTNPFVKDNPRPIEQIKYNLQLDKEEITREGDVEQAYLHEIFGNPYQSGSIRDILTETVTINQSNRSLKIDITAQIKFSQDTQARYYADFKVAIVEGSAEGNWKQGDKFNHSVTVTSDTDADLYFTEGREITKKYKVDKVDTVTITKASITGDRFFEKYTQCSDVTYYDGLIEKSNATQPEHEIMYINEMSSNTAASGGKPLYNGLVTAGLVIKADRNFNRLDQLRVWLAKGLRVERLHPVATSYENNSDSYGASNLFSDLAYFLLTNKQAGVGEAIVNADLVDKNSFIETSKFLRRNGLFFNGALSSKINLQSYLTETAPFFLCNFIIKNGRYALTPALPVSSDGKIVSTERMEIKQIFTAGNILEDSFELEYLRREERQSFVASVKYRLETKNSFPEEKVLRVRRVGVGDTQTFPDTSTIETFDFTQFCTTEDHALLAAKYFLALREYVTHTIKFTTTLSGLSLEAGDYIKVFTEAMPFDVARNGTVSSTGAITSTSPFADGDYNIQYFYNSHFGKYIYLYNNNNIFLLEII